MRYCERGVFHLKSSRLERIWLGNEANQVVASAHLRGISNVHFVMQFIPQVFRFIRAFLSQIPCWSINDHSSDKEFILLISYLCFIAALFEISNPSDSCCWCKHCFWKRLFQLYTQWVLVLLPQSFLFSPLCCLLFVYVYEWGNFWKVITINNGAFPVIYQNIPGSFHHYACICRFGWAKQCPNCCCLRNMLLEFNPPHTCTFSSSISMQRTTLKCVKFPLEYSSNKSH